MNIDDLGDLFDVDIDEEEVDTVGGLLAKAIGRVPIPGSHAPVAGLSLTAEKHGRPTAPHRDGHRATAGAAGRRDVEPLAGGSREGAAMTDERASDHRSDATPTPTTRRDDNSALMTFGGHSDIGRDSHTCGVVDRGGAAGSRVPGGVRLPGGPPERRQVDADQRPRRAEGRDHLLQAADHPAHHPRHRHEPEARSWSSSTPRGCTSRARCSASGSTTWSARRCSRSTSSGSACRPTSGRAPVTPTSPAS